MRRMFRFTRTSNLRYNPAYDWLQSFSLHLRTLNGKCVRSFVIWNFILSSMCTDNSGVVNSDVIYRSGGLNLFRRYLPNRVNFLLRAN